MIAISQPLCRGLPHAATEARVIIRCGAGISVSAGIPDFRSPGTGLYSQLQKYNLERPEDVFDLEHYRVRRSRQVYFILYFSFE